MHLVIGFRVGNRSKTGEPYANKSEAINASLGRARACIVYDAAAQSIAYSQHGHIS
jgi:hypothetical protein